jgi:hypothetical protein
VNIQLYSSDSGFPSVSRRPEVTVTVYLLAYARLPLGVKVAVVSLTDQLPLNFCPSSSVMVIFAVVADTAAIGFVKSIDI